VTGGFRTRAGMEAALAGGDCDVIGLGRPLCWTPDFPRQLLARDVDGIECLEDRLRFAASGWRSPSSPLMPARILNVFAAQAWYYCQIFRLADGLPPQLGLGLPAALAEYLRDELSAARRMHRAFGDSLG